MSGHPKCAKCSLPLTPTSARIHPEFFLHDACLPDELRPPAAEIAAAATGMEHIVEVSGVVHNMEAVVDAPGWAFPARATVVLYPNPPPGATDGRLVAFIIVDAAVTVDLTADDAEALGRGLIEAARRERERSRGR